MKKTQLLNEPFIFASQLRLSFMFENLLKVIEYSNDFAYYFYLKKSLTNVFDF